MLQFIAGRTIGAVVTLLGALLMLFTLLRLVPGDFASIMLGPRATPEIRERLALEMGLDRSLPEQLWLFLSRAATGDFGSDVISHRPIFDVVIEVLPYTLTLALSAMALSLAVGIPLGVLAARRQGSVIDRLLSIVSVAFITTPSLVVSIVLLVLFSSVLHWLPVAGAGDPGDQLDQLRHLILPCLAIALGWIGYIARLVRAALLETLTEPHVRTFRAYGVSERRITGYFALRPSLVPLVAILGIGLGDMIGSAVFAEMIFARPGLGSLMESAIGNRNYPVLQACVLVIVVIYVTANLLSDLLNAILDPRIARSLRGDAQT